MIDFNDGQKIRTLCMFDDSTTSNESNKPTTESFKTSYDDITYLRYFNLTDTALINSIAKLNYNDFSNIGNDDD